MHRVAVEYEARRPDAWQQSRIESVGGQAYYDRFGKNQDGQGFYEDPALDELIAHAGFETADSVFEFGSGTGKFAARLLQDHLPPTASYRSVDLSPIMIGLARQRLEPYGARAKVALSEGEITFPLADHAVDRVVSNYVLDLFSDTAIQSFFLEAHRTLRPGGRVCIASLTRGVGLPSRLVSSLWMAVFRLKPALVGGCRPIKLDAFIDSHCWHIAYRNILAPFGVPSEVWILEAIQVAPSARE